jgi:hypothetical protein
MKLGLHCKLRPMKEPLPVAPTRKESIRRRKRKDPKHLFGKEIHFNPAF